MSTLLEHLLLAWNEFNPVFVGSFETILEAAVGLSSVLIALARQIGSQPCRRKQISRKSGGIPPFLCCTCVAAEGAHGLLGCGRPLPWW